METLSRGPQAFKQLTTLALIALALTSCAKHFGTTGGDLISVPAPATVGTGKDPLRFKIPSSSGSEIDLSAAADRPLVLIFSQDTCVVCHGETEAILAQLKSPTIAPSGIKIVTVLVGADGPIASDWKKGADWPWTTGAAVPWEVAYQDDDALFKSVCPGKPAQVPCLVIQMPGQGIVFKKVGETTIDEIKTITGPWEAE